MAGGTHTDPIVISSNTTQQVSAAGEITVTIKWYKIPATPIKACTLTLTVAGGGPYQVGVWIYRQNGSLMQAAAAAGGSYTFGPTNEDIYLAVMGPDASTSGLFGATPGTAIPASTAFALSSTALTLGEDRLYPQPISGLPFTYSVPSGYPGSSVFFSMPAGVDVAGAFLFVSTLGSSVTSNTGLSVNSPVSYSPFWEVTREIPVTRGGLQKMAVGPAAPLNGTLLVGVHTSSTMPVGLGITFDLRSARSVSGTVLDSSGAPAARTVLLIRRIALDSFVVTSTDSAAGTGAFELMGDIWNGEYLVAALDAGSTRNDVAARIFVTDSINDPWAPP